MLVQATGAPAFSAASTGGSFVSQWTPRNRRPVTFSAASETSQRSGGTMTSGWISLPRSKPASPEIIGASVTPPGTRTLTVTPAPSRSFAMIALSASSAALDGPYVGEPAFNIVPRLVVTLMTRPQPSRIISGTTAFASANGAVV